MVSYILHFLTLDIRTFIKQNNLAPADPPPISLPILLPTFPLPFASFSFFFLTVFVHFVFFCFGLLFVSFLLSSFFFFFFFLFLSFCFIAQNETLSACVDVIDCLLTRMYVMFDCKKVIRLSLFSKLWCFPLSLFLGLFVWCVCSFICLFLFVFF